MHVGEHWAYREKKGKPLVEVALLAFGKPGTSQKIKVQHLDDQYEGKVEWCPKIRLKVPWNEHEELDRRERLWDRARTPNLSRGETRAYEHVYVTMVPTDMLDWDSRGCTIIPDVDRLITFTCLDRSALESPRSFEDAEGLIVPWTCTLAIVKAIVRQNPRDLVAWVESEQARWEEVRLERGLTLDEWLYPERGEEHNIRLRRVGESRRADVECWNLLREWAGEPAYEIGNENLKMRRLITDFAEAAQRAVSDLPQVRTKRATATRTALEKLIQESSKWR